MTVIPISSPAKIPDGLRFEAVYFVKGDDDKKSKDRNEAKDAEDAARQLAQEYRKQRGHEWTGDVYVYEAKPIRRFRAVIVRSER